MCLNTNTIFCCSAGGISCLKSWELASHELMSPPDTFFPGRAAPLYQAESLSLLVTDSFGAEERNLLPELIIFFIFYFCLVKRCIKGIPLSYVGALRRLFTFLAVSLWNDNEIALAKINLKPIYISRDGFNQLPNNDGAMCSANEGGGEPVCGLESFDRNRTLPRVGFVLSCFGTA